jgi:hypothetical protein
LAHEEIRDETDGDPITVYEDTEAHEPTGFHPDDTDKLVTAPPPGDTGTRSPRL